MTEPEVIEISSDESDVNADEPPQSPLEWPKVVTRLLSLAKDRDLLDVGAEVTSLLKEMHISMSSSVHSALLEACNALGEFMEIAAVMKRCRRSSEALALVLCEVLSLAPVTSHTRKLKQQVDLTGGTKGLLSEMNKWRRLLIDVMATGEGRQSAVYRTMARLESLLAACDREIARLDKSIQEIDDRCKHAEGEWLDALADCEQELGELDLGPGERGVRLIKIAHIKMRPLIQQFQQDRDASASSKRKKLEMTARHTFFGALVKLVMGITSCNLFLDVKMEACEQGVKLAELSNEMLDEVDDFCAGLGALVNGHQINSGSEREHFSDLASFARQLKCFWLIYRNQLPPGVAGVVGSSFGVLVNEHMKTASPLQEVTSRISHELQEMAWATENR